MFLGHFAVGFALKRLAPRASLGWLMAAPIFLDLIWPIFLLAGVEQVAIRPGITAFTALDFVYYPFSHSLLAAIIWSGVAGGVYYLVARYKPGAVAVAVGVFSHWMLDAVAHRPDLPLFPGGSKLIGLGLWNSISGTLIVEFSLFAAGIWLYSRTTRADDGVGRYSFWSFAGVLVLIYVANALSTPPDNVGVLAATALLMWIFPLWSAWFDRHRSVTLFST